MTNTYQLKSDYKLKHFVKNVGVYMHVYPGFLTLKEQQSIARSYLEALVEMYPGIIVNVIEYIDYDCDPWETSDRPALTELRDDAADGKLNIVVARAPGVISRSDEVEFAILAQFYTSGVIAEADYKLGIVAFRGTQPTLFDYHRPYSKLYKTSNVNLYESDTEEN